MDSIIEILFDALEPDRQSPYQNTSQVFSMAELL